MTVRGVRRDRRPNIVFVITDDLRFDGLGCTGRRFAETPNIDRLAREGASFTNVFTVVPLCSPSRASFLTGLYEAGLQLARFDRHVTMMADDQTAYLLVRDVLESAQPHRYDWLLTLARKAEPIGPGLFHLLRGKRAMTVYLLAPAGAEASQEPLQVLQRDAGGRTAQLGWRLAFQAAGSKPVEYEVVLALHAAGEPPQASMEGGLIRVSAGQWQDWLAPRRTAGPIASDGYNAAVRTIGGQVTRWAVHDATRLSVEGHDLCVASAPVAIAAAGSAAVAELRQAADLRLAAGRASKCLVNGKSVDCAPSKTVCCASASLPAGIGSLSYDSRYLAAMVAGPGARDQSSWPAASR